MLIAKTRVIYLWHYRLWGNPGTIELSLWFPPCKYRHIYKKNTFPLHLSIKKLNQKADLLIIFTTFLILLERKLSKCMLIQKENSELYPNISLLHIFFYCNLRIRNPKWNKPLIWKIPKVYKGFYNCSLETVSNII